MKNRFIITCFNHNIAILYQESSAEERDAANFFTHLIFGEDKEPIVINEDEETDEFWDLLGEKQYNFSIIN